MQELISIGQNYLNFCEQADTFIDNFKEFYKEKRSKENGKDIEKLYKIQADSDTFNAM